MRNLKAILIVLSGASLCCLVRSDSDGFHDLFEKLNEEILDINHQTAQFAWDTK